MNNYRISNCQFIFFTKSIPNMIFVIFEILWKKENLDFFRLGKTIYVHDCNVENFNLK